MLMPLKRYAEFQGRSRRKEYWLFYLFYVVGALALLGLSYALGDLGLALYALFVLALFVPSFAVLVRRLHDTNRSGWWCLISFIPLIGAIILLVFLVQDGTPGPNRFGASPKAEHTAEVFA
jgi:uncharacterized membrane protein YhaH (DUF805 family)